MILIYASFAYLRAFKFGPMMLTTIMPFTIRYAIPMKHESCVSHVTNALSKLDLKIDKIDLSTKEVVITSELAPSVIVQQMQSIGRDAFVLGSGGSNSAAVAILENVDSKVHGLTRLIQVEENVVLLDLVVDEEYLATNVEIRSFGDISSPPESLGPVLHTYACERSKSIAFTINTSLPELIGKSVYLPSNVFGIIARSAGLWENDKTVCACSGKSMWEEREDFRNKTTGNL